MRKIHKIIDNIGQYVAPNSVSCTKFSRSNQSKTKPRPTYVSLSYETKVTFLDVNTQL